MQHPMQPIHVDKSGVIRFKQNAIIRKLLNHGQATGLGLNELICMNFSDEDHMQLAQLIGYSTSGYGDLGYVSKESVDMADAEAEALSNGKTTATMNYQTQIKHLKEQIKNLEDAIRDAASVAFKIHPDDLVS